MYKGLNLTRRLFSSLSGDGLMLGGLRRLPDEGNLTLISLCADRSSGPAVWVCVFSESLACIACSESTSLPCAGIWALVLVSSFVTSPSTSSVPLEWEAASLSGLSRFLTSSSFCLSIRSFSFFSFSLVSAAAWRVTGRVIQLRTPTRKSSSVLAKTFYWILKLYQRLSLWWTLLCI